MAADYRAAMLQIKELEKSIAPQKKALTEYAKSMNVPSLRVGELSIEKRITMKAVIDSERVTPVALSSLGQRPIRSIKCECRLQSCPG